ncbi:hypothetical protein IR083_10440 [Dysgonomonas sp. GY75]|uniref:methylation-associated defense system protein MAD7 n=1 Tax=Dysgonomonas sp. GY75 TaxID=2780419 RepID=UPI00188479F0|nr:hypothetical protein [Dysgonomonas sp. GY75]MBF0649239.1 hypothetical protein [Dysgonomonas sp. GY75]
MIPKLTKYDPVFRNELIFAGDAKNITLDTTLINLFMLMRNNGSRIKLKLRHTHTIDSLKKYLESLEKQGHIEGYKDNEEAGEDWLRSNLINMVNRGNLQKENISSLRPMHLESYRIRNVKYARDYNSSDQVYLMLSKQPNVLQSLKDYLSIGWDESSKTIVSNSQLDVDTVGVLHLMRNISIEVLPADNINRIKPLLERQADLFCDDIKRLLVYKNIIPRNIFIEYLQTLIGFHLSLYFQKLIVFLPRMIKAGKKELEDDWSIVVDVTDNLDSRISSVACADMLGTLNSQLDYFKSTMQINAVMTLPQFSMKKPDDLDQVLSVLANRDATFEAYFMAKFSDLIGRFTEQEDKEQLGDFVQYEKSFFDKYVLCLTKVRGAYQFKHTSSFLDKISMKNTETAFIADGRSRKHPRRAVLGSGLLETLVQLLVLEIEGNKFVSKPLSIDELIDKLRDRYGIIINGLDEARFANTDVQTHLAFKENVEAFKNKLRQIGFYTDLSDANILQKIRPRYKI